MSDFIKYVEDRVEFLKCMAQYVKHEKDYTEFEFDYDLGAAPTLISKYASFNDHLIFLQMVSEEMYCEQRMQREADRSPSSYLKEFNEDVQPEIDRLLAWKETYRTLKDLLPSDSASATMRYQWDVVLGAELDDIKKYDPTARRG